MGGGADEADRAALDVWQEEPAFSTALLAQVDLATPHIAGHSYEGKLNGTLLVSREFKLAFT